MEWFLKLLTKRKEKKKKDRGENKTKQEQTPDVLLPASLLYRLQI